MKALKLSLIAILACAALVSCKKKDETTTSGKSDKDKRTEYIEYLTNKKGWVLESATSSPAYELLDGSFATDLMKDGYLEECELDEILKFTENGGMTINPGDDVCEYGYPQEVAATWSLSEDLKTLTMQLPFFYNDEYNSYNSQVEECQILSLTESQLRIKYTFDDYEAGAKKVYSFTLTYKINK